MSGRVACRRHRLEVVAVVVADAVVVVADGEERSYEEVAASATERC